MNRERKAFLRGLALGLCQDKMSIKAIAHRLNVTRQTVYRWIQDYNQHDKVIANRPRGRSRKTTGRSNRLLVRLAVQNNKSSTNRLKQLWREPVSASTVYRRLREAGLRRRRMALCPLLTPAQTAARLEWAMRRVIWRAIWNRVIFTDESRFRRFGNDGRVMVWRTRGTRYHAKNVKQSVQGAGGSVHVWGAIWKGGRSHLSILQGAVNHRKYLELLHEFFNTTILPDNFIYQLDNAPPHRAAAVTQYLNNNGIRTLPWPSRSPDLNTIEHVWDYISARINLRDVPAQNLRQLENWISEEWANVPQHFIDHLVDSLPRRISAVINAYGGNTRY